MASNRREITYRDFLAIGHEMKGVSNCKRTFVEALDIVCERNVLFPKEALVSALCEALFANGIIKSPEFMELCLLDSKIMSRDNRNYKMYDLFFAVAAFYMIREYFPRTQLERVNNGNPS